MNRALLVLLVLFAPAVAQAETPLERGAYLVRTVAACGNCHTPKDADGRALADKELAGGLVFELPIARISVPNITPDPETGIGRWSDAELIAAIREGRRPDGRILGPPMPVEFYRGISDGDVRAMVAYLRAVKPVRNE